MRRPRSRCGPTTIYLELTSAFRVFHLTPSSWSHFQLSDTCEHLRDLSSFPVPTPPSDDQAARTRTSLKIHTTPRCTALGEKRTQQKAYSLPCPFIGFGQSGYPMEFDIRL